MSMIPLYRKLYEIKWIYIRNYGDLYGRKNKMAEQRITGYHLNFNVDTRNYTHPHKNTNSHCLIHIREGSGFLKVGEELFLLSAGQCFFQPADTPVCYWADGKEWKYLWILFDGPIFQEMLPKIGFSERAPIVTCTEEQQKWLGDICANRYDYHGRKYYETLAILVHLLASFIETFPSDTQMIEDNSTKSITTFIAKNLHRSDLNVKLLMQVTGLGRTALYDKFRRKGLSSPSKYIRDYRLTKAKHLLRSTELPVGQIAFAVGFEDPLYFSRLFKASIGNSPTKYRKYFQSHGKTKKE